MWLVTRWLSKVLQMGAPILGSWLAEVQAVQFSQRVFGGSERRGCGGWNRKPRRRQDGDGAGRQLREGSDDVAGRPWHGLKWISCCHLAPHLKELAVSDARWQRS